MIFPLIQDFADAVAAMPEAHPRRRILALLDEAIRRDVPFVERHPTTLFQCLWNSCWWYDSPERFMHGAVPFIGYLLRPLAKIGRKCIDGVRRQPRQALYELLWRFHLSDRAASDAKFSDDGTWFAALSYHGRTILAWNTRSLWQKCIPSEQLEHFIFHEEARRNRYATVKTPLGMVVNDDTGAALAWLSAIEALRSDGQGRVWAGAADSYVGIYRLEGDF